MSLSKRNKILPFSHATREPLYDAYPEESIPGAPPGGLSIVFSKGHVSAAHSEPPDHSSWNSDVNVYTFYSARITHYYINTNEIPGENMISSRENNMLFPRVKISPLLSLHNKSHLSQNKTVSVKWFDISLVFI